MTALTTTMVVGSAPPPVRLEAARARVVRAELRVLLLELAARLEPLPDRRPAVASLARALGPRAQLEQ
jgi:hypothetical protein